MQGIIAHACGGLSTKCWSGQAIEQAFSFIAFSNEVKGGYLHSDRLAAGVVKEDKESPGGGI